MLQPHLMQLKGERRKALLPHHRKAQGVLVNGGTSRLLVSNNYRLACIDGGIGLDASAPCRRQFSLVNDDILHVVWRT